MYNFNATLEIVVENPFVYIPSEIPENIFQQANKRKGHIPIKGTVNGKPL